MATERAINWGFEHSYYYGGVSTFVENASNLAWSHSVYHDGGPHDDNPAFWRPRSVAIATEICETALGWRPASGDNTISTAETAESSELAWNDAQSAWFSAYVRIDTTPSGSAATWDVVQFYDADNTTVRATLSWRWSGSALFLRLTTNGTPTDVDVSATAGTWYKVSVEIPTGSGSLAWKIDDSAQTAVGNWNGDDVDFVIVGPETRATAGAAFSSSTAYIDDLRISTASEIPSGEYWICSPRPDGATADAWTGNQAGSYYDCSGCPITQNSSWVTTATTNNDQDTTFTASQSAYTDTDEVTIFYQVRKETAPAVDVTIAAVWETAGEDTSSSVGCPRNIAFTAKDDDFLCTTFAQTNDTVLGARISHAQAQSRDAFCSNIVAMLLILASDDESSSSTNSSSSSTSQVDRMPIKSVGTRNGLRDNITGADEDGTVFLPVRGSTIEITLPGTGHIAALLTGTLGGQQQSGARTAFRIVLNAVNSIDLGTVPANQSFTPFGVVARTSATLSAGTYTISAEVAYGNSGTPNCSAATGQDIDIGLVAWGLVDNHGNTTPSVY